MKQNSKTSLALAIGTTFITGLNSTVTLADANTTTDPFAMSELSNGYMNLAEADNEQSGTMKMKDGSCGEGKCGGKMKSTSAKTDEGKCGAKKADGAAKAAEGKCGDKKMDAAGSVEKVAEGKCGDKKAAGEMKAKEGKCGDKK